MTTTARWLVNIILNREIRWLDPDTDEVVGTEPMRRFGPHYLTWWTLRPRWIHDFASTRRPCGCRYRITGKQIVFCSDHCGFDLETDAEETR